MKTKIVPILFQMQIKLMIGNSLEIFRLKIPFALTYVVYDKITMKKLVILLSLNTKGKKGIIEMIVENLTVL